MKFLVRAFLVVVSLLVLHGHAHSHSNVHAKHHAKMDLQSRQTSTGRFVFAHHIVGIVGNRKSAADWDADMKRAKSVGIDAFALNIGMDTYTDQQLQYAYTSAQTNGMKVFLSFDFNWYSTGAATAVGQKIAQYANLPAQFKYNNKVFVSTFVGDGLDVNAMRSAAGVAIDFVPNFHPYSGASFSALDGAFNWMGWPHNGMNRAPQPGATVTPAQGDQQYITALNGKDYMAPASPWFFTHFGREVSYAKNWLFPGDRLWFDRWTELLKLGPRFIEIVSWNDYGESHYVGPLSSPHTDDGASKWANDMPHDGWLDMAKPYIAAFKAGATTVDNYITADQLFYWYRPQTKNVNCDSTDTCYQGPEGGDYYIGRPNGYETVADSVFVVSLLRSAGTVQASSGSNTQTFNVPKGASLNTVPLGVGQQKFALTRNSATVLSGTSLKDIISGCVCGIYNFNAYVGMLPASSPPALQPDGLANFQRGLRVSTCSAAPSLGKTGTASTASATTTASRTSTATTRASATTTTSGSATPSTSPVCVSGSGQGNYGGLCAFACNYGYCPSGPCTCTQYGQQIPPPPSTGTRGVPADGLDSSYAGLCSFDCDHGYCPSTACKVAS